MKNQKSILLLFLMGALVPTFGSGLTIYASDNFYQNQDRIDTTNSKSDHYLDLGIGLDDISGSGVSFHSNIMYSNALTYLETDGVTKTKIREPFQISTGYLDWVNSDGKANLRLGRQMYTNLAIETFDFDGLKVALNANPATMINFGGGLIVPTPTRKFLMSNMGDGGILLADFCNTNLPGTTLNGAVALEKSLQGDNAFRAAAGAVITPAEFLQFDGSGRFSTAVKGFDHLDGRLKFQPSQALRASVFFTSEKGRIDSVNYFSVLMHEQLTEVGFLLDYYPEGGGCVEGGYHVTTVKNEGADHFFLVNAANQALEGGLVFGTGFHGMTLRPHGGINFSMGKYLFLKGSVEYNLVDEKDEDSTYQTLALSAGVKGAFFPIGLTIYPRVEYITNRYYSRDVRFLITTSLLFHNYWRSDK